jgi:LPS O-antigen subunit length determinant protein (WzzB/FepE family)
MIFLITLIGFWALVFASFIAVAVAVLIERVLNEKKKEDAPLTQNGQYSALFFSNSRFLRKLTVGSEQADPPFLLVAVNSPLF